MNPERHRLVTGTGLRLQWTDAYGVRYDDAGKSFDVIAQDHQASSDTYRELLATDPSGETSATHEAFENPAYARALPTEDAIGRRAGDLCFDVDPVQVPQPEGRIVPRRPTPETGGEWKFIATPGAARPEVTQPHDSPTTGLRP